MKNKIFSNKLIIKIIVRAIQINTSKLNNNSKMNQKKLKVNLKVKMTVIAIMMGIAFYSTQFNKKINLNFLIY